MLSPDAFSDNVDSDNILSPNDEPDTPALIAREAAGHHLLAKDDILSPSILS
jgi:hypothetical protein